MNIRPVERYIMLGAIGVGVVLMATAHDPSTAWAAVALVGAVLLWMLVLLTVRWWAQRREVRDVKRDLTTPWTRFTRPHPADPHQLEIGFHRRTRDGITMDRRVLRVVDAADQLEVAVAEREAEDTAKRWTQQRIGM